MTMYCLFLTAVVIAVCFLGYETASRDLLQQVFLARKLTHRLAECLCTALVLLIQAFFSPSILMWIIPSVICILYVLATFGLEWLFKHKESNSCTDDHRKKVRETALCTFISCLSFVGVGLLVCQAVFHLPNLAAQLCVSARNQIICYGMSMGVNTLLLAGLIHYLLVLRMHPSDDDNPSRELLRLRKELRVPHRI